MILGQGEACRERILTARIVSEYLDMPGLSVTLAQACRLWGLEREECARVLHDLVDVRFLRRSGDSFVRADTGRAAA